MRGTVVYLHGFLSSPKSYKASLFCDLCARQNYAFEAPDLNLSPKLAAQRIEEVFDRCASYGPVSVAGASLGGFYAAWIAQKKSARAVLINPALSPWEIVDRFVGVQKIYGTDRTLEVLASYGQDLQTFAVERLNHPECVMQILTTGDEVLDWRRAAGQYADCPSLVIEGSNHMVSDFDQYAPVAMRFLTQMTQSDACD